MNNEHFLFAGPGAVHNTSSSTSAALAIICLWCSILYSLSKFWWRRWLWRWGEVWDTLKPCGAPLSPFPGKDFIDILEDPPPCYPHPPSGLLSCWKIFIFYTLKAPAGTSDVEWEPGGTMGLVSCVGVYVSPCVMLHRSFQIRQDEVRGGLATWTMVFTASVE